MGIFAELLVFESLAIALPERVVRATFAQTDISTVILISSCSSYE